MKLGHLRRRVPRKAGGLSWGRVLLGDGTAVSYRLFLRCSEGKCFMEARTFDADAPRIAIARAARGMRAQLRWRVDQIEFARLGLVDTAPMPQQVAA